MEVNWFRSITSIGAITLLAACGGGSGSGDDKKNPNDSEKESQEQASDEAGYNYDFKEMTALNSSFSEDMGFEPAWSVRVAVNGQETTKLEKVGLQDVKGALSGLKFNHYDLVRTEVTIYDEDSEVLATNLESVASVDASLKKIWDEQCSYMVNPEHEVKDTDYEFIDGENRLVINLDICDFAGFSLKPVVQIKPQKKNLAKKLVIYHCEFSPDYVSTSSNSPYIHRYTGDTKCDYGYETLGDEEAPKIEILKDFAPGTSLYNAKLLRFDDVKLGLGNAGQFKLDTDFYAPPFGSLEACHTIKLDVKFANDAGIATQRMVFKRSNQ